MDKPDIYIQAERRLAELQGFCETFESGGTLIHESGYVMPKWARDDGDSRRLEVDGEIEIVYSASEIYATGAKNSERQHLSKVVIADHPSKEAAVRMAVIQARIAQFEGEKK